MSKIRIQKYLSNEKITSRRTAEKWLEKGYISVNGKVAKGPTVLIDPAIDIVEINTPPDTHTTTIAYYKPKGIVSNCPQTNETDIQSQLPKKFHSLSTIGRLDKSSEGLILLTNDGVLANQCLNATTSFEKEYEVTVDHPLTPHLIETFESGMLLDATHLKPVQCIPIASRKIKLILTEGKNRQIRRMFEAFEYRVHRLIRTRYHTIRLDDLKLSPNEWILLENSKLTKLFK